MGAIDELIELQEWIKSGHARSVRVAAGIPGSAMARDLDVTPGAITRWETGQRMPRGANARRYYRALRRLAEHAGRAG